MHPCQSLPACSPHPLSGLERERWGAGGRVQGEAGGRAARLELPDMGTRLTAGSNWLPSESLPLPLPDKVCAQPLFFVVVVVLRTINEESGMRQKWGGGGGRKKKKLRQLSQGSCGTALLGHPHTQNY